MKCLRVLLYFIMASFFGSGLMPLAFAEEPFPADESCNSPIIEWADWSVKNGAIRTAHILWPKFVLDEQVITRSHFATLQVDCEEECKPEEKDYDMYSFFRATHYLSLEKIFNEYVVCHELPVHPKRNLFRSKTLRQVIHTRASKLELIYNSKKCALPKHEQPEWDGCISIKASPL